MTFQERRELLRKNSKQQTYWYISIALTVFAMLLNATAFIGMFVEGIFYPAGFLTPFCFVALTVALIYLLRLKDTAITFLAIAVLIPIAGFANISIVSFLLALASALLYRQVVKILRPSPSRKTSSKKDIVLDVNQPSFSLFPKGPLWGLGAPSDFGGGAWYPGRVKILKERSPFWLAVWAILVIVFMLAPIATLLMTTDAYLGRVEPFIQRYLDFLPLPKDFVILSTLTTFVLEIWIVFHLSRLDRAMLLLSVLLGFSLLGGSIVGVVCSVFGMIAYPQILKVVFPDGKYPTFDIDPFGYFSGKRKPLAPK